jgi:geranylgeranyl reductase family protein
LSEDSVDVAVVGGGPAGAWTSYRLARGGVRVAVIDGSHPREKPCGGGVTRRALEIVQDAVADRHLPAVPIDGATFGYEGRSARCALAPLGGSRHPLLVTARRDFDSALLEAAVAAGAHPVAERATDIRPDGQRWIITTRRREVTADWIVGADGVNSLVRRRLSRPWDRTDISIATGYFVHGATSRDVAVEFVDDPPGYLWSFPRTNHLAVGVCAQADRATAGALQACAADWISSHVGRNFRTERYSWPIPSLTLRALRAEQPAGRRWILAGDAAGLVDPITREGIYFALRSAECAAESLMAGGDAARRYTSRVRAEIYPELQRAASLKERFYRPPFLRLLITALHRSAAVRAIMADLVAGEQAYSGLRWRLLRTFEWKLMFELFGLAP